MSSTISSRLSKLFANLIGSCDLFFCLFECCLSFFLFYLIENVGYNLILNGLNHLFCLS